MANESSFCYRTDMGGRLVLALDQGTTGSTALLFDTEAKVLGRGYREFTQHYPRPGWVEHDPDEIESVTLDAARQAIDKARVTSSDIAAMGIANQRETTLLWDRTTGKPVHRAIVWQCRRTEEICATLRAQGAESLVRKKTGLLLDPYFSATKIAWILRSVPKARELARAGRLAFGTIDSWLIWKLTDGKVHATDPTNASRTLLYDLETRSWSSELCHLFGVPESVLPEIRPSASHFGDTAKAHLGSSIPILGVAGDQQSALFGHDAVLPGRAKCTFGTGAFALLYSGDRPIHSKHGLLTTMTCDSDGGPAYGLEGSIFIAGAVVQWLRDELKIIARADETEAMAASVSDTGGVYLVPAFVGLGAPYWDPEARGAVVGITRGTNRNHLVRAALESIAYQTVDLLEAMAAERGEPVGELRVDGGATANRFLMQFLADLLGAPVIRPAMTEMTAFGAARLAAIGAKLWDKTRTSPGTSETFEPSMNGKARDARLAGWKEAVGRTRSKRKA